MMSSDSQAMGRVGEVITRTWQTAHKMKEQRGPLPTDSARNDNFRIKRFIAKYTINPAITHGIAAPMGDPNASIPTPQPVHYRTMFGALGGARKNTCVTFLSGAALLNGVGEKLGLRKRLVSVINTRTIGKKDLIHNHYQPVITVDSQTYDVRADGVPLVCAPASRLPLAQRYFLF